MILLFDEYVKKLNYFVRRYTQFISYYS